jgi:hypothetical protein
MGMTGSSRFNALVLVAIALFMVRILVGSGDRQDGALQLAANQAADMQAIESPQEDAQSAREAAAAKAIAEDEAWAKKVAENDFD